MKTLTNKQLDIIEPLKKIISEEFYLIVKLGMQGQDEEWMRINSNKILKNITKEQIQKVQEVRARREEYNKSLQYGLDLIKKGMEIIEEFK